MLIVRGVFRTRFRASSSDLTEAKVMTEHDYYGPFQWLPRWLFENKIRLRFVMLLTADSEFTVDMKRDTGASSVLGWLKDNGWDIDSAVGEAMKTPLVRARVQRVRSY
ncbi:MAG: hypothetical protein WCA81_07650 [Rhizomicrobium sp.]